MDLNGGTIAGIFGLLTTLLIVVGQVMTVYLQTRTRREVKENTDKQAAIAEVVEKQLQPAAAIIAETLQPAAVVAEQKLNEIVKGNVEIHGLVNSEADAARDRQRALTLQLQKLGEVPKPEGPTNGPGGSP